MSSNEFQSSRAPEPVGPYPHARRVGNLLFLSGIGPRRRDSRDIPGVRLAPDGSVESYDIEAQCRSVFDNVRAVLEDAGARWEDLVDVTVFLTNIQRDFAKLNQDAAEEKYKLGTETNQNVVFAQQAMAQADLTVVSAQISLRRSLLNLMTQTGELLDDRGIVVK